MSAPTIAPTPSLDEAIARHQRGVWRFLRWLGADPALADDLTQDAFVQLLQHPPLDCSDPALASWLRTTATNLFRSQHRRGRFGVPLDDPDALATLWRRNASDDDGERYLAALAHCLQSLPPTPRSAIELHYRHRQRHEDLAAKLGITSAGVKSLLRRARELLERCITNRLRSEP